MLKPVGKKGKIEMKNDVREGGRMVKGKKTWNYLMVAYWAIVLVLTVINKMMLSMYFMAIGMFVMAIVAALRK